MDIETLKRGPMRFVGLRITAHWRDLGTVVPDAWKTLFARRVEIEAAANGLGGYAEISLGAKDGVYSELVCIAVDAVGRVPEGLVAVELPENTWLRTVHNGPLSGITDGFGAILSYARENGLPASELKLDTGYEPGLLAGRHELFIALEPAAMPEPIEAAAASAPGF